MIQLKKKKKFKIKKNLNFFFIFSFFFDCFVKLDIKMNNQLREKFFLLKYILRTNQIHKLFNDLNAG